MKILCICGARPNFMKVAAVIRAMEPHSELDPVVVHTGQHYDERMSRVMFEDLELPRPNVNLEVGSASHAVQTAEIMQRFEEYLVEQRPDLVMVVGDVNSTVACSLVAVKLGVPVAHVEAGLRSFDRTMPEEINRVVTDALAHLLFVSEPSGMENLRREGVPEVHLFFVGNVMIDTLVHHRKRSRASRVLEELSLEPGSYAVLTLHRPANVDDPAVLERLAAAIAELSTRLPVVFPVHPRTRARLEASGALQHLEESPGCRVIEPLGYLDFLRLQGDARLLLTDSGGIQEEATILHVPCLTLRPNTERPATLASGWNRLVGTEPEAILQAAHHALDTPVPRGEPIENWDGRAGERIARVLLELGTRGVAELAAARSRPRAGH